MAATAAAASDVSDGPVLSFLSKRLRALRKKLNRIAQMEEAIAQGKPINKEQEEVLRSKPGVVVLIDELEKLRQPLADAVAEEVALAVQRHQASSSSSTPPSDAAADDGGAEPDGAEPAEAPESDRGGSESEAAVEDLLKLLYFGSLFDVKSQSDFTSTMLTRTHERGCCLTYDYVTDDATDLLGERDLDLISRLGGLLISRPADSSLSHQHALQSCLEHAKLWLARSDILIEPNANTTYSELRERLNKILASDYLTTTPEMKAPVEVAAAAAAGNYASFQVPIHGSVSPVPGPVQVEGSVPQYQQQDEETADFQGHEMGENQSSPVEERHQEEEPEMEHPGEPVYAEQDQTRSETEVEYTQRDFESTEQHYVPRRPYQSQRGGGRGGAGGGGGRRGYPNGRGSRGSSRGGGGPFQNGRNQYYDQQPGGYYQRNYYNNRGRGGRGGGPSYNNHGSAVQGGQVSTSVGVGS